MKAYDPSRPLLGLHIPKCAGQSLGQVLRGWFGRQLRLHYFDERRNRMPQRHRSSLIQLWLRRSSGHHGCVYGHFNRARGFGVEDYYPSADQFFTVVRDPLAAVCSSYFFAKQQGTARMRGGRPAPIAARYRSLDEFVADRLRQPYFASYLPGPVTLDSYAEVLERSFVHVGVAEELQASVDRLAARLGLPSVTVPHANRSSHDETLSPALAAEFVRSRPLDYAIYRHALERHR